jgi:hypothetical protein
LIYIKALTDVKTWGVLGGFAGSRPPKPPYIRAGHVPIIWWKIKEFAGFLYYVLRIAQSNSKSGQ